MSASKISIGARERGGWITDCDNAESPINGVLNGKMSESSAGTWKDHPIALLSLGVLDGTVDGDTLNDVCGIIQKLDREIVDNQAVTHSTKNRSGIGAWESIRDGGDV